MFSHGTWQILSWLGLKETTVSQRNMLKVLWNNAKHRRLKLDGLICPKSSNIKHVSSCSSLIPPVAMFAGEITIWHLQLVFSGPFLPKFVIPQWPAPLPPFFLATREKTFSSARWFEIIGVDSSSNSAPSWTGGKISQVKFQSFYLGIHAVLLFIALTWFQFWWALTFHLCGILWRPRRHLFGL